MLTPVLTEEDVINHTVWKGKLRREEETCGGGQLFFGLRIKFEEKWGADFREKRRRKMKEASPHSTPFP